MHLGRNRPLPRCYLVCLTSAYLKAYLSFDINYAVIRRNKLTANVPRAMSQALIGLYLANR